MSFMENVSAFTKGVGQKTKGNYDIVTMNAKVSSLAKEIKTLYTQVGEAYYGIHKDDPEEAFGDMVEKIKSLETQIAAIKQQIEETKTATAAVPLSAASTVETWTGDGTYGFCECCGAALPKDSSFCVNCGAKVSLKETAPEQ